MQCKCYKHNILCAIWHELSHYVLLHASYMFHLHTHTQVNNYPCTCEHYHTDHMCAMCVPDINTYIYWIYVMLHALTSCKLACISTHVHICTLSQCMCTHCTCYMHILHVCATQRHTWCMYAHTALGTNPHCTILCICTHFTQLHVQTSPRCTEYTS